LQILLQLCYSIDLYYYTLVMVVSENVAYFDRHAEAFALHAADPARNWFEHEINWPSIETLTNGIGGLVLDYGCADALFTERLKHPDRVVHGSDASPTMVAMARQRLPDTPFSVWDGTTPSPFAVKFNLIVSKLVFQYIEDVDTVAAHLADATAANGTIVISISHPERVRRQKLSQEPSDGLAYSDSIGDYNLTTTMYWRSQAAYEQVFSRHGVNLRATMAPLLPDHSLPKRLNMCFQKP
jgi:trans-aconitate methyltransferase